MDFTGTVKAAILLSVWSLPGWGAGPAPQESAPPKPVACPRAALWLVSTRALPCGLACDELRESLDYWRCGDDGWQRADSADFHRQTRRGNVTFFVHGNWITASEAFAMGTPVRDALSPEGADAADTVVVWSWPSAQESRRRLADVREKAERSEAQGRYLAQMIDGLPPERPASLVGYSYGARLITSALQNREADKQAAPPLSAVLMAAALDDHWLLPGHRHGDALFGVERLLVLINSQDPVLERYRFLYGRRSGAQALGYVGLPCVDEFAHVEQWRVDCYVGRTHDWTRYIHSCPIAERVRDFLKGE